MQHRITRLLHLLVDAMRSTSSSDLKYYIQRAVPVLLAELDRAESLRPAL